MKILKIKTDKPIKQSIKDGDNYDIEMKQKYRVIYPDEEKGKEKVKKRFSIKKLKYLKTK